MEFKINKLEEYLKEIEKEVETRVIESRNYHLYFSKIIEKDEPFYVHKEIENNKAEKIRDIKYLPTTRIILELVQPKKLVKELSKNWKLLYSTNQRDIIYDWTDLIIEENRLVFETLMTNSQEIIIKMGELEGIQKAVEIIKSHGNIPNTLIINNSQIGNLKKFQKFKSLNSPNLIHSRYYKDKLPNFQGTLDHLDVYINSGLPANIGIICDKENNNLKISPLTVKFENYDNPRILSAEENIYAYYDKENSLVKLIIT